jgi:tetratricopeptide (TPR) repeat protein
MQQAELFQQALGFHQAGQLTQAIEGYQFILADNPNDAQVLYLLGTVYCQIQQSAKAIPLLQASVQINPDNPYALNNLATILQHEQPEQSLMYFHRATTLLPNYPSAWFNQGNLLARLGQTDAALASLKQAIAQQADYIEAIVACANLLRDHQRIAEAFPLYASALQYAPHNGDIYFSLAIAQKLSGQVEQAYASYQQCIQYSPDNASAWFNLGNLELDWQHYQAAIEAYDKALSIRPHYPEAYLNRGNAYGALEEFDAALNDYNQVISLKPNHGDAYCNRGNIYKALNQVDLALANYQQADATHEDYAEAKWNQALMHLVKGEYLVGWALYEWRLKMPSYQANCQYFDQPEWRGDFAIQDKVLLVYAEQGYGDCIQFCRYLPQLLQRCAKLVVQVHRALVTLIQTVAPDIQVIAKGSPLPAFDAYCPLLSLPYVFHTSLDTVPANIPYLATEPARVKKWKPKTRKGRPWRIGLAWSGSDKHENDHNRSIALAMFAELLSLPVEWHSLQKEYRPHDMQALQHSPLQQHQAKLTEFADTAALIQTLDMVISVDTAVAHLAGALGKPVWLLMAFAPEYRWLLSRNDSPWYPTMRIFRQRELANWQDVMEQVQLELAQIIRKNPT